MKIFRGQSICGTGMCGIVRKGKEEVAKHTVHMIEDAQEEIRRFRIAWEKTASQLEDLYQRAKRQAGEKEAEVFAAHKVLLEDEIFTTKIEEYILQKYVCAEEAVEWAKEEGVRKLLAVADAYISERSEDVADVADSLLMHLQQEDNQSQEIMEEVILWIETLSPSLVLQLEKDRILGVITKKCSGYSHAAILAKTMGIPLFVCEEFAYNENLDGKYVMTDSEQGVLYLEPTEAIRQELGERIKREKENVFYSGAGEVCGKTSIHLMANIGSIEDVKKAEAAGAEGIGLFRSECVFLERDSLPTEEEQFQIYKALVEAFPGKVVTIRTLDMGSDKQCSYLPQGKEENPALGIRGIRLCLENRSLFKEQLRALLRAAVYGKLRIIYPMISSLEELEEIKGILKEVREELNRDGLKYAHPKQGILIETPAAVLISDLLAKEVDFFSIGTNDLTQYTLAADRQNVCMEKYYNPYHPAMERMLKMVVKNAHEAGIPVSVCGESGGDKQMTELFLQLGLDELSLSPMQIPGIRRRLLELEEG